MNCHEHEADLVDLARRDGHVGLERSDLRRHLDACGECMARFERERQLSAGLRALARSVEVVEANPAAEQQLLELFEARRADHDTPGRSMSGRPSNWMLGLAAAAGLVVFVGATWTAVRWQRPVSSVGSLASSGGVRAALPPAGGTGPVGSVVPRVDTPPADAWRRASSSNAPAGIGRSASSSNRGVRSRQPARPAAVDDEVLTFMPLPAAAGLPELESGRIVRVELPVTSLPAFGLDIVPSTSRLPIEADVIVGQDGQARAIRLVSLSSRSRRIR